MTEKPIVIDALATVTDVYAEIIEDWRLKTI